MKEKPGSAPAQPALATVISAAGGSVAAQRIDHVEVHPASGPGLAVSWPVQVGQVPAAASAFQSRPGPRGLVEQARASGDGVVLTQVLSGSGGVGKTQLAASYARQAVAGGTDLVVWADAAQPGGVIDAFARAARTVGTVGAARDGVDAEEHARQFLAWAAVTPRSWLVVLDDVADPGLVARWWPASQSGTGWVIATTRRRDAMLSGSNRVLVDVGVYTSEEAVAYLIARLGSAGLGRLAGDAAALAEAVGFLPLALSHAAAYLIDQQISCAAYLDRYSAGQGRLEHLLPASGDADGYGRPVAVTLLLALDTADACDPAGLARPAITLAALLDPAGHPAGLWAADAVTSYLASHRTAANPTPRQGPAADEPVTPAQARAVLLVLHRYGMVSFDEQAGPRAVRVHALTGRAAREAAPAALASAAILAAADALAYVWPDPDEAAPELAEALRASTATLARHADDTLWQPDAHPVLFQAGSSLLRAGLHAAATAYWQPVAADSERILGPEHPDTLTARASLAFSYWQAGRTADAITIEEQVTADRERILGSEHPDTLTARANLAFSYWQAGRTADAITILAQVTADRERILGSEHPSTLTARANLAFSYWQAGRTADAITIEEQVTADMERILGPEHPDTLTARANLAASYRQAGRTADAITILAQVTADSERILGPEHPDTLTARANLAASYRQAGRTADAITIEEQVTADMERILGPEHPDTLTARANLAASYRQAGRTADAITIDEQVTADMERILGPEHPSTLTARANLAASYRQAGRTADAITILGQVTADRERILGPEHPDTLTARANLAASYRQAGRTADAITILGQVTADRERILGPEHPDAVAVRDVLHRWKKPPEPARFPRLFRRRSRE